MYYALCISLSLLTLNNRINQLITSNQKKGTFDVFLFFDFRMDSGSINCARQLSSRFLVFLVVWYNIYLYISVCWMAKLSLLARTPLHTIYFFSFVLICSKCACERWKQFVQSVLLDINQMSRYAYLQFTGNGKGNEAMIALDDLLMVHFRLMWLNLAYCTKLFLAHTALYALF